MWRVPTRFLLVRKVCVVVGSRANYGSIKSVMRAVQAHPDLQLQIIVAASALLDRFGSVVDVIERDGFMPDARVNMIVEGETPVTMAKSTGLGLLELPTLFELLKPDVVVTVGDRFETMATAVAGAYMNIPLAHTMGGEVTGTIDESIRHAITKLAHVHFPANQDAADRIIRLGEDPAAVHVVGCPRIDLVSEVIGNGSAALDARLARSRGCRRPHFDRRAVPAGQPASRDHGVRTGGAADQRNADGARRAEDADRHAVAERRRRIRGRLARHAEVPRALQARVHPVLQEFPGRNVPAADAQRRMPGRQLERVIREGAFIGTPAVNIGSRQDGRERGPNVVDVGHDRAAIAAAIRRRSSTVRIRPRTFTATGRPARASPTCCRARRCTSRSGFST